MIDHNFIENIFSKLKENYGHNYDNILFEQYKIYLKNIDNLENRRRMTHNFFLSVNTGLITAFGILSQYGIMMELSMQLFVIIMGSAGILFTYSWRKIINSYISLSVVKWKIIIEIEKKLPLMIHDNEWKILTDKKNKSGYKKLTTVELWIPIFFIIMYIAFIAIIIIPDMINNTTYQFEF